MKLNLKTLAVPIHLSQNFTNIICTDESKLNATRIPKYSKSIYANNSVNIESKYWTRFQKPIAAGSIQ